MGRPAPAGRRRRRRRRDARAGPTRGTSRSTADEELDRGVHFALSTPGVHAFCTPGDIALLPRVLASAERYAPLERRRRGAAAVDAMAAEELIFPMPR